MNYDVTVVTVVYELVKSGRKDMFLQCMNSVARQDGVCIEHIIVDGGSIDGTKEIITEFAARRKDILWISESDKGIYDAMNKGLRMARGRYITFLNSDDYYHDSNGLRIVVELLDSSKSDFSYAPVVIISRDGTRLTTSPHIKPDLRNLLKGMPFSHQSVLVRTELMKQIGGFNTVYYRSADYAFIVELIFAGRKAVRVEKDFVTFRTGGFSCFNPAENQREHTVAFSELSKRYIGRELTEKELKVYVYACVLRTFGPLALQDGWNGTENDIALIIARELEKNLILEHKIFALRRSAAYRIGVGFVWPARKVFGGIKCLRENGVKYTVKHTIGKVLRKFGSKCKW